MVEDEESDETRELKVRLSAAALLNASLAAVQCLQMNAIYDAVLLARRHPELYVLPGATQTRAEGIRFAERSVVFDLALRMSKSENVIWSLLHDAETMIGRLPKMWAEFRGGRVPHSNVRTAAELVRSLPDDSRVFDELDALLVEKAARLTPSKFRSCVVPHCSRASRECDMDHTTDWQFDGCTNDDNLAPLSRGHHSLKHKTRITVRRDERGGYVWATLTGFTRTSDPPPF